MTEETLPADSQLGRRPYSLGEEIANSVIHGVGVVLSVVALTLLLEFAASTLYHSFPQPRVKHVFKILDHAGIYLLIAGTYTPFILVTLRGDGYWWMLALVWAIAVAGIAAEALFVV
jgi:hemolysin III